MPLPGPPPIAPMSPMPPPMENSPEKSPEVVMVMPPKVKVFYLGV